MNYRQLGKTELMVSRLSLGTVALGLPYGIASQSEPGVDSQAGMPPPSDRDAIYLVHQALDGGINFIDTALAYGRSEELLGQALQDRREQVVLTTKVGCHDAAGEVLHGTALRQHMQESIASSLGLLRTDHVDLLMLHSASVDILEKGEALNVLQDFQRLGYTRYIGASTYGIDAPRMAIDQGVEALQVAYNILDQRMADDIFPLADSAGIGIIVRSIFLKGVLTPRADDLPEHLTPLKQRSETVKRIAAQLTPPLSRIEVALRFALSQTHIASVLVGVHSGSELSTALGFAKAGELPRSTMARLELLRWDNPTMLDPSTWGLP